ncbi:MAG: hypothetical protein EBY08_06485 [Actinobacteria bacterium]|nr:hypothetical protein [Actinomycetota bacterium]
MSVPYSFSNFLGFSRFVFRIICVRIAISTRTMRVPMLLTMAYFSNTNQSLSARNSRKSRNFTPTLASRSVSSQTGKPITVSISPRTSADNSAKFRVSKTCDS